MRKREDGYHDLETIFYPVYGLHDELEVEPAEEFAFLQDGLVNPSRQIGKKRDVFLKLCKKMHKKDKKSRDYQ